MARTRPRMREYRMMLRIRRFGILLKIISRNALALGIHQYFKEGKKRQHRAIVVEDITFNQLKRLMRELERQLVGVRQWRRMRFATRSAGITVKIRGCTDAGFVLYITANAVFVPMHLSAAQLSRLIANLKHEHAFAARETRTNMVDN